MQTDIDCMGTYVILGVGSKDERSEELRNYYL